MAHMLVTTPKFVSVTELWSNAKFGPCTIIFWGVTENCLSNGKYVEIKYFPPLGTGKWISFVTPQKIIWS